MRITPDDGWNTSANYTLTDYDYYRLVEGWDNDGIYYNSVRIYERDIKMNKIWAGVFMNDYLVTWKFKDENNTRL